MLMKENLQGMRVVKSFNQEANEEQRFTNVSDELRDVNIQIGYFFTDHASLYVCWPRPNGVAIYSVGNMVNTQPELLAQITGFTNYIMIIMNAIIVGGMMMSFATRAFVSMGRIQSIMDTEPTFTYDNDNEQDLDGRVEFDDVSFTYQDDDQPTKAYYL